MKPKLSTAEVARMVIAILIVLPTGLGILWMVMGEWQSQFPRYALGMGLILALTAIAYLVIDREEDVKTDFVEGESPKRNSHF